MDRVRATWSALKRPAGRAPMRARIAPGVAWHRLRERLLPNLPFIVRLTAASVVAYLIVEQVYPGSGDLTGALTALLVVRASLVETFSSGLDRIAAVLTGVLIASLTASVTGLTWWSLAIVVAAALALAWAFDLSDNRMETAISAMLILGASSPETSASARVGMTLIGAAVGFAGTLLFPPPVLSFGVAEAVGDVTERSASATRLIAAEMRDGMTPARFDLWIRALHRVLPEVATADTKIRESENRRRYNPRALGEDATIPVLRAGLASVDRVVLALRHALMSLQSRFPVDADEDERRLDPALEGVFAVVFDGIADAVSEYGAYVQALATGREDDARRARRAMSEHVDETRAMLTDLSLADPSEASAWMFTPDVLSSLDAVLIELSPARQDRRLAGWQARQSAVGVFRGRRPGGRRGQPRRPPGSARAGSAQDGSEAGQTADAAREEDAAPPTLAITYRDALSAPEPVVKPKDRRDDTRGDETR